MLVESFSHCLHEVWDFQIDFVFTGVRLEWVSEWVCTNHRSLVLLFSPSFSLSWERLKNTLWFYSSIEYIFSIDRQLEATMHTTNTYTYLIRRSISQAAALRLETAPSVSTKSQTKRRNVFNMWMIFDFISVCWMSIGLQLMMRQWVSTVHCNIMPALMMIMNNLYSCIS